MKKLLLILPVLLISGLWALTGHAQTTEYFESQTANATSFTNATTGFAFTLTNNQNTGGFYIEDVPTFGVDAATPPTVTGYSSFYVDNFNETGAGQIDGFKSSTGKLFSVTGMWVYPSSDPQGNSPSQDGSVTFTGKIAGVTQYSFTIAGTNFQNTVHDGGSQNVYSGFQLVNFTYVAGSDYSHIPVDEIDLTLNSNYVYVAVDNFEFSPSTTVTTGSASNIQGNSATLGGSVNPSNYAVSNIYFEYSSTSSTLSSGVSTSTASPSSLSSSAGSTAVSANLSGLNGGTIYYYRVDATNAYGTTYGSIQSFTTTSSPTITVPGGTTTLPTTPQGTAGTSSSFTISASNLTAATGPIYITAPTGVDVSNDNSTWSSNYQIGYSNYGGTIPYATIYVRLNGSGSVGPISGNVQVSGGGATTANQAVSGTLNTPPAVSVPGGTIILPSATQGSVGSSTTFNINGSNLFPATGNLTIAAPTNTQVSADNSTWVSSYTQSYTGGTLGNTPVYVRLSGTGSAGTVSGSIQVTGGGLTTAATEAVSGSLNAPSTTISSLTATSSTTTNAFTVLYTATFAASVSGLTTSNFRLTTTGSVSGAAIGGVSQGSGNTWTISVLTGSGSGTIQLSMNNSNGNSPSVSNLPFGGDTYTIDKTAPTVTIGAPSVSYLNSAGTVSYTVTWSDANLNTSSISLSPSQLSYGGNGYAVNLSNISITGSGNTRTISITGVSGDGSMYFSVPSGTATDNAGNSATASNTSTPVTIDNTAPTVSNLTYTSNNSTNSAFAQISNAITLSFTTSETVQTPVVTIAGHTVTASSTGSNSYSASYIMTSGDTEGRIPFSLSITDLAGNNSAYTDVTQGDDLTFDMTPPTVAIGSPSVTSVSGNGSSQVSYTVTYSDANFNTSTLTNLGINLYTTGTANADVNVSGSGTTYTITLANITGSGKLSFGVKPGYSTDDAGNFDSGQSPSAQITVLSNDASLGNLSLSNGTLSPGFNTNTTSYTAPVGYGLANITVTPTTTNGNATVTVNGNPASTPVPVTVGQNNIQVKVTAQDGVTTQTYTVVVTEVVSPINTLYSLKTSAGFAQGTTVPATMTESVTNSTTSLTVTPTTTDANATVKVNGVAATSGQPTAGLMLNVGANTITIAVTAVNNSTKTYTLTVTRAPSANDNLSNIAVSSGTLSPAFGTPTNYLDYVANGVAFSVTPVTADPTATVTVNGNAATSEAASSVPLTVGNNTISIVVTAQSGATKTYTLVVNEARSPNSTLYSLVTSAGLSQGQTVPTTLTESVPYSTSSITVTPTTADPTATVTVNGTTVTSGQASNTINLNVGANTITVIGTAQAGNATTYTLTVTRAASSQLTNLTLSAGTLSPAFASGTTTYNAGVGNGVSSITLIPTAVDPNATIKVNGATVTSGNASGAITLAIGNTNITVAVTAADNSSTTTYTIAANEARSSDDALLSFKTSAGLAKGKTVPTTLTESVVNATSSITITPTVDDPTATVTVNSVAVTSGTASASIPLAVGQTTITTIVTAQTGVTQTYTLTVTRAPGSNNNVYQPIGVTTNPGDIQLADDGIVVHQGISPNGDGINDYLQIDNISQYPENNLKIMNRNGLLVFEAKGYDNATKVFDGHSNKNGQMQLPGTYFYELDYTANGITKHKTGYLVLKY